MKIPTKYNIGQNLFYVNRIDNQVLMTCPVCDGSKKTDIENYGHIECPNCQDGGNGMVVERTDHKWVVSGLIAPNCLNIQVLESPDYFEGIRVSIRYSNLGNFGEHHLFATKKEAEEWCIEANKDPMGNNIYHGKEKLYKLEDLI